VGQLADAIAQEDPWNGELTVRLVDQAFISADEDQAVVDSWRL
jgi:hypothetical protein